MDRTSGKLTLFLCFCLLVLSAGAPPALADGAADGLSSGEALASSVSVALAGRLPRTLDPPAALPILPGGQWRYFPGITSAPPAGWNTVGFDDGTWAQGASGFGYGDGDDATVLAMQNSYYSVYVRREFTIADLNAIGGLVLTVDYDDGFVAYINGTEVARSASMSGAGTPPAYNTASGSHEAVAGGGGPAESFPINKALLQQGTNVVAIQGHNQTLGSTDFTLIPSLTVLNAPPAVSGPVPADGQAGVSTSPQLCVTADDPEGSALDVSFYGREAAGVTGAPFTIIALPDTQYYSASYPATLSAQTSWIRDQRLARNIVFATELGDCTDQGGIQAQWDNATASFSLLEDPATTGLVDGIPYGIAVGNHDQSPNGDARTGADENVTTVLYNQTFPRSRFQGRAYHGGQYPLPGFADSMDNHYELFSAGGMDFIAVHLEWDDTGCSWPADGSEPAAPLTTCQSVLSWMRGLLTGPYASRHAMITTHWMGTPTSGGTGTPAFSAQGQAIYNAVRTLPNVFMMLGGHLDQGDHRTDLADDGHEIHTLISDFQSRPNGGNGWLRIMTFDPESDTIHVETYSPTLGRYINKLADGTPSNHADNLSPTENEITLGFDMDSGAPFVALGSDTGVPSGSQACIAWPGRQVSTTYEWYAVATDGSSSTVGSRQSFSTTTSCSDPSECDDANPCTTDECTDGLCVRTPIAECCQSPADCDDANACTDDACTDNVCAHANNTAACSDGNLCTTADTCSSGVCSGGPTATCNDNNACTADSCAPATGCEFSYAPTAGCCTSAADCDDGIPGTEDTCSGGACSNAAPTVCSVPGDCDDGNACTADTCNTGNGAALQFDGVDDRVTMGAAPTLSLAQFTLECWFNWTGGGVTTTTGSNGLQSVIPLVTKGRGEAEGSNVDMNYHLGIQGGKLAADFEEGPGGAGPLGNNHPVVGTITITPNAWHHAAASYDGATWTLYLDGQLDTTLAVGQPVRSDSIQHFGLGTAMTSTGVAAGFFQGALDEVRVWDHARQQSEIQADMNTQVLSGSGLVARWGMEDGSASTIVDSVASLSGTMNAPVRITTGLVSLGDGTCSHDPVANCCLTGADCYDADTCTIEACVSNACVYEFSAGSACDDSDPATCGDTCVDPFVTNVVGTESCNQAASITGGFISTNKTWTHTYPPITLPIISATLTVDIGDADGYVMTLMAQGNVPIGTITGGDNGVPGTWACPDAWIGGADTTITIPNTLFADLADGTFEVSTTGGGSSPPGSYGINRSILHIQVASCQGSTVGCCTLNSDCDDNNVCTQDTCLGGACQYDIVGGSCDDGNACTVNDACTGGVCSGDAAGCDDGDACTVDSCDASGGCLHTPLICDDGDACTLDQCDPASGCMHQAASCDDGNACTTDTCDPVSGCRNAAVSCDDTNVCTDDACDPASGCLHAANSAPCDDGSACTADLCMGGSCVGTPIQSLCEDGEACSTDACSSDVSQMALDFDGANDYVSMGAAPGLNASPNFTVETWFRWDGSGVATSTGSGGISAIPLVSKGRAEAETPANLNMNYFLGIFLNAGAGRLAGDFEDAATGLNHPVCAALSTPAITTGVWHHAAMTYNSGGTIGWKLYLDGVPLSVDTACSTCAGGACTTTPGAAPEPNSIQRFALGSALTSATPEAPAGFFDGALDEVRVWGGDRSASQISAGMNRRISAAAGLKGRWGLDDGVGSLTAADSSGTGATGSLLPTPPSNAPVWVAGSPALGQVECTYPNAPDGTTCSDANACTTGEMCSGGACGGGSSVPGCCIVNADCNDGAACTTDTCESNVCVFTPVQDCCLQDSDCDDGSVCTADACNSANDAAVDLRGAGDYVDLGQDATANNFINSFGTSSFTVEGWFYADGVTADLTSLFRAGRQGAFPQVVLQLRTSGGTWLAGSVETNSAVQIDAPTAFSTAASVALGQWHHAALVVDRSVPQIRVYLNGALIGTANPAWLAGYTINMPAGDRTVLGATRDSAGALINNFNGRVDEWRVWSYARTQAQIQADRSKEIMSATGLVHRWGFNEAAGAAIDDPGTFDGTLTGGAVRITSPLPVFGDDRCTHTAANEGGACSDGTACTSGDVCAGGTCAGAAVLCDDGSACTADACDPAVGCVFTPVGCDDGNPCTADGCDPATGCTHAPVVCDDGDACTIEACDPVLGCVFTPVACDDGDACTMDSCDPAAGCRHVPVAVDDGDACTADACDPATGQVSHTPITCNDNDVCTADACDLATGCTYAPVSCDDGDACTVDSCDPAAGCHHVPVAVDDGDACTADACDPATGQVTHAPITCDDGDACTADACDPAVGCVLTPVFCDDGDACTTDACDPAAGCSHTAISCDDGQFCNGMEVCDPATGCHAGPPVDCNDGIACTVDACDEAIDACTHAANACAADITGTISYYRDGVGGTEPAPRTVSDVTLGLTGTGTGVPDSALSGMGGTYAFTGKPVGESYTVAPVRLGGFFGAVSSFDAALVARSVVGLTSLTPNQLLAADSSGNGDVSSFDAAYIARMAAGLIGQLPAAALVGSDWFVVPIPSPVPNQSMTNPDLPAGTNGSVSYTPLSASAAGQDFAAGLFGDVSANWVTVAPASLSGGMQDALSASGTMAATRLRGGRPDRTAGGATLTIDRVTAVAGDVVEVSLLVEGADEAIAFDLDLGYDPSVLTPLGVAAGTAAPRFTVTPNLQNRGHIFVSLFSPDALGSPGSLVTVRFQVSPDAPRATDLSLAGLADEGRIPLAADGTTLRVKKQR